MKKIVLKKSLIGILQIFWENHFETNSKLQEKISKNVKKDKKGTKTAKRAQPPNWQHDFLVGHKTTLCPKLDSLIMSTSKILANMRGFAREVTYVHLKKRFFKSAHRGAFGN